MPVKDIDKGYKGIMRNLNALRFASTKVGVQQNTERDHGVTSDAPLDTLTMAEIAFINEFGNQRIPARSAMRLALDKNLRGIRRFQAKLVNKIYQGDINSSQAIGLLGEFFTAKMKASYVRLKSPPNAPSTLDKKAPRTNPLIDSGQLRLSIDHAENI